MGTRPLAFATSFVLLVSCSPLEPLPVGSTTSIGGGGAAGTGGAAGGTGGQGGAPPRGIAALSFPEPAPWADPIDDYLEAGYAEVGSWDFMRDIHDLIVYQDRLYLGYGDANENLGRVIPISIRSIASHEDPIATSELDSDEEQLDHYRRIGNDLFMPGVDATEDAWLGNVYFRRPSSGWTKSRTLDGGVHVHDVAGFNGVLYAVGSGATEQEWFQGQIFSHLWRSDDGGATFVIADRHDNGGDGDARWVRLLPVGDELYLFGYSTDSSGRVDDLLNARFAGSVAELLASDHPLANVFVIDTDIILWGRANAFGLALGVDRTNDPLRWQLWKVEAAGSATLVGPLVGKTVVDIYLHRPTGQSLVLAHEGDDYLQSFELEQWQVSILVTEDFEQFDELVRFSTTVPPRSIAFWRDCLFYGTGEGQIWRSVGVND